MTQFQLLGSASKRGHSIDLAEPRIKAISHPVTQEVSCHDDGGECQARERCDVRGISQVIAAGGDHSAEGWAGRGIPAPRKLSVASVRIRLPVESVVATKTVLMTPGKMCLASMRRLVAPDIRAEST